MWTIEMAMLVRISGSGPLPASLSITTCTPNGSPMDPRGRGGGGGGGPRALVGYEVTANTVPGPHPGASSEVVDITRSFVRGFWPDGVA